MEDLENRLSAIGYRPLQKSAEFWQVSPIGETAPTLRMRRAPQRSDPACSRDLRFWLRRLGRFDASSIYRIRRAM
jgi:hypothetical protein